MDNDYRQVIKNVEKHLSKPQVTLLIGSRQVGKTTILKMLQSKIDSEGKPTHFFNLEIPKYLTMFNENPENIVQFLVGDEKNYVFIDEIQYLKNPSNFLKLLYDEYSDRIKFIVSGSSAFYIDQKFKDSLAGRKRIFNIRPYNFTEFLLHNGKENYVKYLQKGINQEQKVPINHLTVIENYFAEYLVWGGYPMVVRTKKLKEKQEILNELVGAFVKKDMFDSGVRNSNEFFLTLEILANRCGNLLNITDLSKVVKVSVQTIQFFLYVLEKSFHLSLVRPYFNNYEKEIIKMPKIYFQDNGFRNVLTNNLKPLIENNDKGILLENMTYNNLKYHFDEDEIKFWHTKSQNEVDFIVGDFFKNNFHALEVKYSLKDFKESKYKVFKQYYPNIPLNAICFSKGFNVNQAVWEI